MIASGGKPKRFVDFKDDENIIYFRSMNDFYKLKSLAEEGKKIAIIGGGFIGSEIAAALALKKCKVTMIFPENGICGNIFPCNLSSFLNDYYQQKEINILNEDLVNDIKYSNMKNFTITTKKKKKLEAEVVVIGIGVEPNISFLKGTNIEIDKGIKVDKHLVTNNPSIFAAGDVTGAYQFTHAAGYEGGIVLSNAILHLPREVDYTNFPWCTYTDPELASIGMNEKRAAAAGIHYSVWTEEFKTNDRSLAEGAEAGKIKLLLNENEKPIGIQILGPRAGELVSEWVAILNGKVKLSTIVSAVHPYPTLGEINKKVLGNFFSGKIFSEKVKKALKFFFNLKGRACM